MWLNLADTYASAAGGAPQGGRPQPGGHRLQPPRSQRVAAPKNLLAIPWRLVLALQSTGQWWLRQAIIWHKPNAMPESVRDRPACNYEYLFLLTPSARYYFNLDPIRIPATSPTGDGARIAAKRTVHRGGTAKYVTDPAQQVGRRARGHLVATGTAHTAAHPNGRNPVSVWSIPTRPTRLAHYAAFPIDLPLRAIAAGCPPGGLVCDPFSGTATTGLAALRLGRTYIGIDINACYHDLALARLLPHVPDGERP